MDTGRDSRTTGNAEPLTVLLAEPRGFCAGVDRAIAIVEEALARHGAPVYVRHEIVHNGHVVDALREKGAVFVEDVEAIPEGAVTIFSAHGVSPAVEAAAAARGLDVVDATCPLVRRVHLEGRRYAEAGYDVILIGHEGHVEVEGTRGQIGERLQVIETVEDVARLSVRDPDRVAYVTQTTLSVSDIAGIIAALKDRFPNIVGPDTRNICYATHNRQQAVREVARAADLLLVVGAANSSNSNRLREIGEGLGVTAHLIDGPHALDPAWLGGVATVAVTAGASAPEVLVEGVLDRLRSLRAVTVRTVGRPEPPLVFKMPSRFAAPASGAAAGDPADALEEVG